VFNTNSGISMKYIMPISVVLILITIVLSIIISMDSVQQMTVVYAGNEEKQPLVMTQDHFQCSECGMVIQDLRFASQVIAADGKTWFFDDHGCMAVWVKQVNFQEEPKIWLRDLNSGEWVDAHSAWYSRTDSTPMLYGFGAYTEQRENYIDFSTMQNLMLKGETFANPTIRQQLLGD